MLFYNIIHATECGLSPDIMFDIMGKLPAISFCIGNKFERGTKNVKKRRKNSSYRS